MRFNQPGGPSLADPQAAARLGPKRYLARCRGVNAPRPQLSCHRLKDTTLRDWLDLFHHRILSSTLYVPLDAFLVPHIAVGIGPALTQQILHRTDSGTEPLVTTVQLLVEIAGWL